MAKNFNMEQSKSKITEIKQTIEEKKKTLDDLEQQKKSLLDAGIAVGSSDLDGAIQETLIESINDSLRGIDDKVYDVSKDANKSMNEIEQIRENVDADISDSNRAKKKLDQTKRILDSLGAGKTLEEGLNKLDNHLQETTEFKGEVISAMQDLESVYSQLNRL